MKSAVLDASVVLKWFLADEGRGEAAIALLKEHVDGLLEIVAPTLLAYELMSGLTIACRRGRLDEANAAKSAEAFFKLGTRLVGPAPHYPRILHFANRLGCSIYDAAYLALAEAEGIEMITADDRLLERAGGRLSWLHAL